MMSSAVHFYLLMLISCGTGDGFFLRKVIKRQKINGLMIAKSGNNLTFDYNNYVGCFYYDVLNEKYHSNALLQT